MARSTIQIGVVTTGAERAARDLNSVSNASAKLARDTTAHANASTAAVGKLGQSFQGLANQAKFLGSISPVLGGLTQNVGQFGTHLGAVERQAASFGSTLGAQVSAGANVATTALVAVAAAGVGSFLSRASEIRGFQRVIGGSAEDVSKLAFAFHALGIDSERAPQAFSKFARALGAANQPLAAFGVYAARNKDGTVDLLGSLGNLSDAYNKTSDQTTKAAIVAAAFGARVGSQLIPILTRGREGLAELGDEAQAAGLVFSQQQLDQAKNFGLAMRAVQASASGLAIGLANGVVPALTTLGNALVPIINFLNRTHVVSAALAALIAGKLAAALVGYVARGVAVVTGNQLMSVSFARLTVTAEEGAAALAAAQTEAATAGASMSAASAGIAGLAGPVGLLAGLAAGLIAVGGAANKMQVDVEAASKATTASLVDEFQKATAFGGGGVGVDLFRKIAEGNLGTAERLAKALRAAGVDTSSYDRILKDVSRGLQQATADAAVGAAGLDDLGDSTNATADKTAKAVSSIDQLANTLTGLNSQLSVAAGVRSYSDELKKLGDMLSPFNSGEAEHAKRVDDLTRATQDAARATRQREDAERSLNEVRAEDVNLLRDQAQLEFDQANVRVRSSAREAQQAADHVARLKAAGITGNTLAVAEDDAASKSIAARQATQDQAKARRDLANVGPDYERRLADASDRVAQAKQAEHDAAQKVIDVYLKAIQPASELGTTTSQVADEVDRLVKSASDLAKANVDAGLLNANQAALSLAQNLATIATLYPQVSGQIKPIIDMIINSVRVGQEGRPSLGAIPANRAYGGIDGVYSAPHILFGERQTGGEAFIPRLGIPAARGLALAAVAAGWHGGRVVPMAGGGMAGYRETVRMVPVPQSILGNHIEHAHFARVDDMTASGRRWGLVGAVSAKG